MRIQAVDVAMCALDMPHPVVLGSVVYPTRDFVVLRLRTDAGIDGVAIGYTRGTPVAIAAHELAGEILGLDPLLTRSIITNLRRTHGPGWGALVRAASLIDIALWDILARAAQLPLFRLLGGYRTEVPVMAVAGYYSELRSADDVQEEVCRRADAGYRTIKVVLPGIDPRRDETYLSRIRQRLDSSAGLAIDAHASWTSLDQALDACRRLDGLGLAFIEDPFDVQCWRLARSLQREIRTPLAMGEDAITGEQYRDLLDAVTILRVDATASGGISGAVAAIHLAAGMGKTVIPHVFLPLHAQLAGAFPNVRMVEIIPAEVGADPIDRLLVSQPAIADGMLALDDRPGNGIDLDWDAVRRSSSGLLTTET